MYRQDPHDSRDSRDSRRTEQSSQQPSQQRPPTRIHPSQPPSQPPSPFHRSQVVTPVPTLSTAGWPITYEQLLARERNAARGYLGASHLAPRRVALWDVTYQVMTYFAAATSANGHARRIAVALVASRSRDAAMSAAYWYAYYTRRPTWLRREKRLFGLAVAHDERNGCVGYVFSPYEGGPRQINLTRPGDSMNALASRSRPTNYL